MAKQFEIFRKKCFLSIFDNFGSIWQSWLRFYLDKAGKFIRR